MSGTADMSKSEMIRRSMRCYVLGWWSLVPLLGFALAMLAFVDFRAVVNGMGRRWNAGRTRLLVGAWLAGIGILITLLTGTIITLAIMDSIARGCTPCPSSAANYSFFPGDAGSTGSAPASAAPSPW